MPITSEPVRRTYVPALPTSLGRTLGSLSRGSGDPTMQRSRAGLWRATRTPIGPAVQHLRHVGSAIEMEAWGDGAEWLGEHLPQLLGSKDCDPFPHVTDEISALMKRYYDMRIPRTEAVWEALLPAILEQKVTGKEARSSFTLLHRKHSEPAPSPPHGPPLLLPLDPRVVGSLRSHHMMAVNVERKRGDTIRMCASYAHRMEEAVDMSMVDAHQRLSSLPGIGAWTVAEVAIRALGDADAVSVGDYHLKNWVSWNLAGRARGTDEEMLELLEPYRPHRGRVLLLLQLGGKQPPRFGPRITIQRRW